MQLAVGKYLETFFAGKILKEKGDLIEKHILLLGIVWLRDLDTHKNCRHILENIFALRGSKILYDLLGINLAHRQVAHYRHGRDIDGRRLVLERGS
jgi:hypothetical protein